MLSPVIESIIYLNIDNPYENYYIEFEKFRLKVQKKIIFIRRDIACLVYTYISNISILEICLQ